MHFDRHMAYYSRYRPHALFAQVEDRALSWEQTDRLAGAMAAGLAERGLKPGDRFGILLRNSLEWCVGFVAAIRLGAIMVPLNTMFGTFELAQIARDAGCAMVLSDPSEIAKLGITDDAAPDRIAVYDMLRSRAPVSYADLVGSGRAHPRNERSEDDILLVTYTSGTTGVPKGIALSHRAVDSMIHRTGQRVGLEAGQERFLILAPLAFTGGSISNLAVQIGIGGSSWIERSVDPVRALDILVRHRITYMAGVPALWERVAAAPGFPDADLSALKTAVTGGSPVSLDLLNAFLGKGVTIRQQFGVSENCGTTCCPDREGAIANPRSCGPPLPGMELELRDDDGRAVRHGEIGEICFRSAQLMDGYWGKPEATAQAIIDGWYKTGDLGFLDDQGGLVVVDRKKNMLISGGINIYPAEVELAVMQVEGVLEVAVFGLASEAWGQEVAAIVHAPTLSDVAALRDQVRALIGPVKAPKHIVLRREPLPRTVSNKIARIDLAGLYESSRAAAMEA
ncbi:AMP-binding protein [Sphingomonas sp. CGMCC 1.13654]|uniref:AMP-binding protein n=1 Tax=Sphingomonas chungangi TaxID=2683589 RepID=A0A838L6R9_9SPHN|nr:AMP-binding protein [Sphingomonas chungangi]MBA2933846.1 AMP-binding protein [Sphingomonas chungangi]MVW55176.1 AMP-binding protein [Sphingomonas chungangi]